MNGEHEDLFVIGKSEKPRCFRRLNEAVKHELSQIYLNQKNAWMNALIFEKVIKKFNGKMKKDNRKVLLFLDNCTAHILKNELSHVKLIYFPSNTTSVCQPLDQGIISSFKSFYRKNLVSFMISKLDEGEHSEVKNINLLNAINFMKSAWLNVTQNTIRNCFKKAFFEEADLIIESTSNFNEEWNKLKSLTSIKYKSFEEYFNILIFMPFHMKT